MFDAGADETVAKVATKVDEFVFPNYSQDLLCSIEIEQQVLGCLLTKPDLFHEISGFLDDKHFFEPLHSRIYQVIKKMAHENLASTPNLVHQFFKGEEAVPGMPMNTYLVRLAQNTTHLYSIKSQAKFTVDYYNRRVMVVNGEDLIKSALTQEKPILETASNALGLLDSVIESASQDKPTRASLALSAENLLKDIGTGGNVKPISTGIQDLDRVIGGWRKGTYNLIAARPSMGKSCIAFAMMLNAAKKGHNTLLFSLEMTKESVAARCLSDLVYNALNPIPYVNILNDKVSEYDLERLKAATDKFKNFPIEIDDQAGLTIEEIASRCRQHIKRLEKENKTLDFLIIDHLGKIRASKRYAGNIVAETGEISANLACLAKDLNIALLVLHQLNRAVESRDDKHPQLSDIRNTGDIEQDADLVGFLYRPSYYLERGKYDDIKKEDTRKELLENKKNDLDIVIAKQRNGPCVTIEVFADMSNNAIRPKAIGY